LEKAGELSKVSAIPKICREHYHIGIRDDGTSVWEIKILKPNNNYGWQYISEDYFSTKVKIIRYDNNKAFYYDENDNLLFEHSFTSPNMKHIIERIKNKHKQQNSYFLYSIPNTLKSADVDSTDITDLGNGIIRYTNYINADSFDIGKVIEKIEYDTINKVVLYSELMDVNNNLLNREANSYDFSQDIPVPTYSFQELFKNTVDSIPYSYIIISEYEDYKVADNLE
jgi:hypothetical protein